MLGLFALSACNSPSAESAESKNEERTENATPALPEVPQGAGVYFANLEDGDTITSPAYVTFGIKGMEVEPAGKVNEGKGHHHIIIDGAMLPSGETVPADAKHIHYGGGQTGDTLTIPTGKHSLTLQFADGLHRSYGEAMSATIKVYVAGVDGGEVVGEVKETVKKEVEQTLKNVDKELEKNAEKAKSIKIDM